MKGKKIPTILRGIQSYVIFFLTVALVVSCCMMLFVDTMTLSMGIILTNENIESAAKITLVNVVLLSGIFTLIDALRRKYMIERPVKRIIAAAERIMQGDFSVRIQPLHKENHEDGFDTVISYFNKIAEELGGIETLRTDFIANVSHELKTPLAVMQNYGTILQQPDLPEQKRMEYAKAVTDSSRRLANLISNILKLNRLENQKIYPQKHIFNLSEQLTQSLLLFEDVWEQKNIEIEADIADDVTICSDPELLEMVWNNIISNAMKFTPNGGCVRVTLKENGNKILVTVEDTGCGMSTATGSHIFEKFYQGDTSHATEGNGLGLVLVKRIIDITGGEISVQSELQRGSIFTVKLWRNPNEVEEYIS